MQLAPLRVLLVDDEPIIAKLVNKSLSVGLQTPFELCYVEQLSEAFEHMRGKTFDVLLLDLGMPGYSGLGSLQEARRMNYDIAIVVLTGQGDEKLALAALEQGAQDYLVKGGLTADLLCRAIRYAIQRQQLVAATTERRLALEARANLAAIVESSDDAIISESFDGGILSWNRAAQRMFGYSATEALSQNISFLFPAEQSEQLQRVRAAVRQGETRRNLETYFVMKNGQSIYLSLSVSPVRDEQGKIIGISKICRDISERKQIEQALRTSQHRLELAFRGSSDGLGEWSLLTNEAYWSPRTREMLGYAGAEADQFENSFDAISTRMHPEDRARAIDEISHGVSKKQAVRSEFRLQTRSGDYGWFQLRGRAVYDAIETPYSFAGALTDVTDRKQLEIELVQRDEQLRQSHKLEALGSLAGGVAHEFNNLLQAIRGYTKYAMEGLQPDDQRHQDLEQVIKASDRATALTRELLGFSRHRRLEQVNVESRELVKDLVKLLRPLIGAQIDLQVSLDANAGSIYADRGLLQQMLLNLCINARDAMPDGGALVLKTQRVDVCDTDRDLHPGVEPGEFVLFSVTDTGTGIPPEVRERIFEPFFTTKSVGKGTGLGLAMVHGCVQQHGGMITVDSEPKPRHDLQNLSAGRSAAKDAVVDIPRGR